MKFSPLSALKETDLQIDERATVTGKMLTAAFKTLFAWLTPYFDSINKMAKKGVSLSDNVQCEVINGAFTHGTAQTVRLKTLERANGAVAIGCDGQIVAGVSVAMIQQTTVGPLASVTVYFANASAAGVRCAIVLFPEGQQSSSPPAATPNRAAAHHASAQVFTAPTFAVVNYDTVDADTQSQVVTGAAWAFTCKMAGLYLVTANVNLSPAAAGFEGLVALFKGASEIAFGVRMAPSLTTVHSFVLAHTLPLAVGDTLSVRFFGAGTNWTMEAGGAFPSRNRVEITQIPGF